MLHAWIDIEMTISDFIKQKQIKMSVSCLDSNPHMADATPGSNHYRCTFSAGGKRMTIPFTMGSAHTEEPEPGEVLDCLASDSAGFENAQGFEDWASEYGYDSDSIKAKRTYDAVKQQRDKLQRFLGDDDYKNLLWHTERG
jgi:hypothetical protein